MRNLVKMNFNPWFLVLVTLVIFVVNIECQETELKGELTCETRFENCVTDLEHILDMQVVTDDIDDQLEAKSAEHEESLLTEKYEAEIEALRHESSLLKEKIKSLKENQPILGDTNSREKFELARHSIVDYIAMVKKCNAEKAKISTKSVPDTREKWKALKPENKFRSIAFVKLTWKIDESGMKLLDVPKHVVNEWLSSIECMLMSMTQVELKEATSVKDADIPIHFYSRSQYESLNQPNKSIAYCNIHEMGNLKPTAPVYVNMEPSCAKWLTMEHDHYTMHAEGTLKLVHMKYYLAHEIMHSLGLAHQTTTNSMMYPSPTDESVSLFNRALDESDSRVLNIYERIELVKLFANNPADFIDQNSEERLEWNQWLIKNHPKCEKWVFKQPDSEQSEGDISKIDTTSI